VSNYGPDRLYGLLPAVYRQRDAEQGYPLRDLIEIVAEQATVLEDDIFRLYENWFVETCEPWVVPYIGDLVGVRGTNGVTGRRAEVANTLGYRRAKGTAAVLEQLARDVTGWPARVVEFFERLATTQYLNHARPHNLRTPDLRLTNELELLGGPFETAAHTAEVRRIAVGRGRYNIPNVGLFLWRLQAYPLEKVVPRPAGGSKKDFTFNVLWMDEPLFHSPAAETSATHIAEEVNVPAPIRRRVLHASMESYFGKGLSITVWPDWDPNLNPPPDPLPPEDVVACDLTKWDRPRRDGKVAVDPVLGRLSFPADKDPAKVRVTYHYGFSDDLGGGSYERAPTFTRVAEEATFEVGEKAGADGFLTLQGALDKWNGEGSAVIEIRDSRTYDEALAVPEIPQDARLEIRAANEQRPTLLLKSELKVSGAEESGFELNGLLVAGGPVRIADPIDRVRLQHATLAPGRSVPALIVESGKAAVTIERSILGAVQAAGATRVEIRDSIVDAIDGSGENVLMAYSGLDGKAPGGPLTVSRCTVIGAVSTGKLALAENSLFLRPVTAERRQEGCVRFCHVPLGSRVPRRYRCQPAIPDGASAAEAGRLAALLSPRFTSLRYGDPGYCQLTVGTPREIRRGAEDESEMGVFSSLRQPQREDGLRLRLDEYLRVGLEAGIFFVT
jgi:hypothetical protein